MPVAWLCGVVEALCCFAMASSSSRPSAAAPATPVGKHLASLRHLDLRKHSIDELTGRVRDLLHGQALRCLEFAPGLVVYRGIISKECPEFVRDVSYPPAERIVRDQRANRAGEPMFYCSATWHPPFFEAGVKPGDHIIISRWQTRKPLRLVSFGYADACVDDPHTDRERALGWALRQLPDETRALATFLTNVFTRTVHDDTAHHYRLSIAVAEACQLGSAFDGLLYPSAAMPSPAHNLAIHPSFLDSGSLTLQYVEQLRVNRIETETIDAFSLNIAREIDAEGRLHWLNQPGNWVLREGATGSDCRYTGGKGWK